MIWKVENKVTHKVDTWYPKDTIDKIKEVLYQRPYHTIEKVLQILEDAENET